MLTSIRAKLSLIVVCLVFVALNVLAGLNHWQAKKVITQDVETIIAALAQNSGEAVGFWLDARKVEMAIIARSPVMTGGSREAMLAYLAAEATSNKLFENIFWLDDKGNINDFHGTAGNLANRAYFQQAMRGDTVVSDPVVSLTTGKSVVVIATPIKGATGITGVLVGALYIEEIENRVLGVKVGQTGYAYVLRADGNIIIHPNKELVKKGINVSNDPKASPELKAAVGKMLKGESGIASYPYGNEDKYLAYGPIPGTSWSIGVTVPVKEANEKLGAFTWTAVGTMIGVVLLAVIVALFVAARIAKPLKTLEAAAGRIAGGDLSVTAIHVDSKDELGRLARAFETMVANLGGLVRQIAGSSEQVAASAEELTASAEQSAQAANQVAVSVTSTAEGVDRQVKAVNGALALVQDIASGARAEAGKTRNAVDIAGKAVSAANDGNKSVNTAISQMTSIRQVVDNSAKVVAELGERSKEIGQIVETISGIAGQTNLLALNAAIEAARAGEQGRGFAVVAEEVRQLAEQSQEAAKEIAVLIGDIQGKTDEAVAAMADGTQAVRTGAEIVDQAGKAFQDIDGHVKEVANLAKDAADGMNQLTASSLKVLEAMQETEHISGEISGQAQSISAATEEQSASMEEISASSQHLTQMAAQLQNAVAKFKL